MGSCQDLVCSLSAFHERTAFDERQPCTEATVYHADASGALTQSACDSAGTLTLDASDDSFNQRLQTALALSISQQSAEGEDLHGGGGGGHLRQSSWAGSAVVTPNSAAAAAFDSALGAHSRGGSLHITGTMPGINAGPSAQHWCAVRCSWACTQVFLYVQSRRRGAFTLRLTERRQSPASWTGTHRLDESFIESFISPPFSMRWLLHLSCALLRFEFCPAAMQGQPAAGAAAVRRPASAARGRSTAGASVHAGRRGGRGGSRRFRGSRRGAAACRSGGGGGSCARRVCRRHVS